MISARPLWLAVAAMALAGCASKPPAPILDRSSTPALRPAPAAPARDSARDTYTVQRGDTLYRIATANGVDPRDLARWNGISNPAIIEVGQVLRLRAPAEESGAVASSAPIASGGAIETRPLNGARPEVKADAKPETRAEAKPEAKPEIKPETRPEPAKAEASPIAFVWPAKGSLVGTFDEPRNKGIDIAGAEGEAVVAAADGEVAYVGNALRGYGNLVIVKHSDDFVSAYAHNKQVLVKQGQVVKKGQRIAELGKTDADRAKLHFEIRRQGKPVDPLRYLPAR